MLPTTTAHRYLVPTAFGASGRRIPTAVIVAVIIVVVIAAEGTAAAFRPGVAPAAAAAAVLFLAVLLGGPEEPKGLSAHQLVVVGGGVDLLFRGGVDSVRRGGLLLRRSPTPPGTGAGGLLPRFRARPPRRRSQSRTPLHPSAEEPVPHRLLLGSIRESALGSLK